jgi:hypothetical protein
VLIETVQGDDGSPLSEEKTGIVDPLPSAAFLNFYDAYWRTTLH